MFVKKFIKRIIDRSYLQYLEYGKKSCVMLRNIRKDDLWVFSSYLADFDNNLMTNIH